MSDQLDFFSQERLARYLLDGLNQRLVGKTPGMKAVALMVVGTSPDADHDISSYPMIRVYKNDENRLTVEYTLAYPDQDQITNILCWVAASIALMLQECGEKYEMADVRYKEKIQDDQQIFASLIFDTYGE